MNEQSLADKVLQADPGLANFFLGRLARLVTRQATAADRTERMALGAAAFSTFLDCLELGLAEQANAIVEQARDETNSGRCSAA